MKKYKHFLIIMVIIMTIPFIYKLNLKHHKTSYKINQYNIEEEFNIVNKKHLYNYKITNKKEIYSYTIENKANKRKKLIKKIETYQEGNIQCIIPIYKNQVKVEIYCRKDNTQVSKEVLKNDENYKKILKKVKKYNIKILKENNKKGIYKNITYYPNNMSETENIIIWNYKGMILLSKNQNKYQKFLKEDLYDNIMSTTTSRYFVLFENTSVNGINKIHTYDRIKEKYEIITLKEKISKNSYINGVVDDLIYVTDKEKKKQYTINLSKEDVLEVGNEEEQFIKYINNKKTRIRITDFLIKEQYFQNEWIEDEKITKSEELRLENNIYYYREGDTFYKKRIDANKIKLFTLEEVDEWQVVKEDILLRKEDTLYLYNDTEGLRKIVEYNELKYNYKNTYNLWK